MKKTFLAQQIDAAVSHSKYSHMLQNLPFQPYLIRYEAGDFAVAPHSREKLLQIVVSGSLMIYYIRDDGSCFSLATMTKDAIIGESALFDLESEEIYARALEPLSCLAININQNRDALMNSAEFLRVIAGVQAEKIHTIASQDARPGSLRDRVLSFMRYKCEGGRLKGIESAAFQLHCSSRQLQRILNDFEREGIASKVKKGTYDLCRTQCQNPRSKEACREAP